MSSLKSPSIILGPLFAETYIHTHNNNVGSISVNACNRTLGDVYSTKIYVWLPFSNANLVHATSIPLDVNERAWPGCI